MHDPFVLTRKIRSRLAPCGLGTWPTPLERRADLGDSDGVETLWLKREDLSSTVYGGNKVRGLEFLLSGAPAGTPFVTVGGSGSTHCLATAVHAAALSCRAVVALFPQPRTEVSDAVAAACQRVATHVVRARSLGALPFALAEAWLAARRLGAPRWLPGGGATPRAVVGHVLAGFELATQLAAPPDAIVTPLGSGGTAAGLVLATAVLGWPTRVVAVRVAPSIVANRWRVAALARGAARLLAAIDVELALPSPGVLVVVNGVGRGYGHPSVAGEAARARAAARGLALDPTYGAKALAAVPALARRGFRRVVFWHTFAAPTRVPEPLA